MVMMSPHNQLYFPRPAPAEVFCVLFLSSQFEMRAVASKAAEKEVVETLLIFPMSDNSRSSKLRRRSNLCHPTLFFDSTLF
jgi:hypothetical protein